MAGAKASKHRSADISGSVYLITSDGRTLKLPIPSRSYRDPLNWSLRKRGFAFLAIFFYSVVGLTVVQGPSLMFKPLALEFSDEDTKPFELETLLSVPTLFMGIGAFIWIPLSLAIGRRAVFLLGTVVMLSATILAGFAGSFYQLLVAVSLQGLAEGLSISAVLLMVIDLTFIHQRPHAIAFIWSVVGALDLAVLSLVPQMTGSAGTNWHIFYDIWIIPCGISCLLVFFYFPETYFMRPAVAYDGRVLLQDSTEKVKVYENWGAAATEKPLPDIYDLVGWRLAMEEWKFWGNKTGGWRAMLACYPQMILCLFNPLIFWVMILNALVFAGMMAQAVTYASVLSAPPYSLPIQTTSLVKLSASFGSLLAWPAAGLLTIKASHYLTLRYGNGIRHAEYYLPAFILPVLASIVSLVLYGLTVERKGNFIFIYIASGFNSFSFASMATATTLWATEAFPQWAAAAIAILIGGSYTSSFGLSFMIMHWLKSQGYAGTNIQLASLIFVVGCFGVPIAFWGQKVRQYIDGKYALHEEGSLRPQTKEVEV